MKALIECINTKLSEKKLATKSSLTAFKQSFSLFVHKWCTIDAKIYMLDVSGSPGNAITVYLCYFFIK